MHNRGETVAIPLKYYSPSVGFKNISATFARLVTRGLGSAPGRVLLASALEQQVDQGLGALQGALLLRVLLLLLLLLLLLNFYQFRETAGLFEIIEQHLKGLH